LFLFMAYRPVFWGKPHIKLYKNKAREGGGSMEPRDTGRVLTGLGMRKSSGYIKQSAKTITILIYKNLRNSPRKRKGNRSGGGATSVILDGGD